jgi:hypothetical protein
LNFLASRRRLLFRSTMLVFAIQSSLRSVKPPCP